MPKRAAWSEGARALRACLAIAGALATSSAGCGASAPSGGPATSAVAIHGVEGGTLDLDQVVERALGVELLVIGELHGHPVGLGFAAELFERIADRAPSAALSLEAFERDEQPAIDAWLAGRFDDARLCEVVGRDPAEGHRRMLEAARARRLPVYAANAPRRHARLARTDGYDALRELPASEQALFVVPDPLPGGSYLERFARAMGQSAPGHGEQPGSAVEAYFRAQALWDATMADSIATALEAGRRPLVHVVGRFHVEKGAGLWQLLSRARPQTTSLSVLMAEEATDEDRGRADVIVRVGPRPASPHGAAPAPPR